MSQSTTETPEQALARIQAMEFGKNDALVIQTFAGRGIPPDDIDPRHNVLTFNAWKGAGRSVAKGAISVRCVTWIPCRDTAKQTKDGETPKSKLRPKTVSLFHASQTIPQDAPKGTAPAAASNPALVREGVYNVQPWTESTTLEQVDSEMLEVLTEITAKKQQFSSPTIDDVQPDCTCPMVGVVTSVNCPVHGREAVTA